MLLTGVWDSSGHGHDPLGANAAYCVVDHEAEATGATNHASLGSASAPHEHSCVACRLGCSKTAEIGRSSVARPLDLASTAARPENDGRARRGAPRHQAARGPPRG
ncbi:MAG: hypothetical protein OXG74_09640 [Acidobacteria bacterium]|nr:hypothetical protein [Acidobacteriota bacterium]